MAEPRFPLSPIPAPAPDAVTALAAAAAYLSHAGTTAATLLLDARPALGDPALLAAVLDQLLAGVALCDGLLDLLLDRDCPPDGGR